LDGLKLASNLFIGGLKTLDGGLKIPDHSGGFV
jgi:hypothetical protein